MSQLNLGSLAAYRQLFSLSCGLPMATPLLHLICDYTLETRAYLYDRLATHCKDVPQGIQDAKVWRSGSLETTTGSVGNLNLIDPDEWPNASDSFGVHVSFGVGTETWFKCVPLAEFVTINPHVPLQRLWERDQQPIISLRIRASFDLIALEAHRAITGLGPGCHRKSTGGCRCEDRFQCATSKPRELTCRCAPTCRAGLVPMACRLCDTPVSGFGHPVTVTEGHVSCIRPSHTQVRPWVLIGGFRRCLLCDVCNDLPAAEQTEALRRKPSIVVAVPPRSVGLGDVAARTVGEEGPLAP